MKLHFFYLFLRFSSKSGQIGLSFFIILFLSLLIHAFLELQSFPEEAFLDFQQYCHYHGYLSEKYEVVTNDGYILTLFRIQKKQISIENNQPVVLLQHGILDSSYSFIINEPDKSMGFLLANRGYDIWLSNSRGSTLSRKHVRLNPDIDKEYWDFSFQEMSEYDLPAIIQFIHNKTNQQIHYVGHSQGSCLMLTALAERNPIIVKYVKSFIALGPVAYMNHGTTVPFDLMKFFQKFTKFPAANLLTYLGNQFMPHHWFYKEFASRFCFVYASICNSIIHSITSEDPSLDNVQRYPLIIRYDPTGTSMKNIIHFEQLIVSNQFRKFDYGPQQNQQFYGKQTPPFYNLSNIKDINITLIAGTKDRFINQLDALKTASEINNTNVNFILINASHTSFVWGIDMSHMKYIYNTIEENRQ